MIITPKAYARHDRNDIDYEARQLVIETYREACRTGPSGFDAALKSYLDKYPHISMHLAIHAVAHILATAGM